MKTDFGTVLVACLIVVSAIGGFLAGEIVQEAKWDGELDDAWNRGFHWGWLEGCSFAHENWTEGPCKTTDDPNVPSIDEGGAR